MGRRDRSLPVLLRTAAPPGPSTPTQRRPQPSATHAVSATHSDPSRNTPGKAVAKPLRGLWPGASSGARAISRTCYHKSLVGPALFFVCLFPDHKMLRTVWTHCSIHRRRSVDRENLAPKFSPTLRAAWGKRLVRMSPHSCRTGRESLEHALSGGHYRASGRGQRGTMRWKEATQAGRRDRPTCVG